jgi:predicted nucleotide-binding protein
MKSINSELENYREQFAGILKRFKKSSDGWSINFDDDPVFRQSVVELIDLFNDNLGPNQYSTMIVNHFNDGISNFYRSPSYKSVENIIGVIGAAIKRFERNPNLIERRKELVDNKQKQNVFIIHGKDEAKWRELKDIIQNQFRLNPIILQEQADIGKTVIEKFEHYAKTCSYAIAVFTPDDEVTSGSETYLQARPNVIYELGWFCGHLGRENVMLLLKNGTSMFSDFGGIVQKRFTANVTEKINEIKLDLIEVGIMDKV